VFEVIKYTCKDSKLHILDIGTGSGCILLSILSERKKFNGTGIDISIKSINISRYNAKKLKLNNRTKFYVSDVDNFLIGKYDIVKSNPPYIENLSLKYLDRDV
jgi:release factor glutamine methyltransferase